jgi:hypothetical protein
VHGIEALHDDVVGGNDVAEFDTSPTNDGAMRNLAGHDPERVRVSVRQREALAQKSQIREVIGSSSLTESFLPLSIPLPAYQVVR